MQSAVRQLVLLAAFSSCAGALTPAAPVVSGESFVLHVNAPENVAVGQTFGVEVSVRPVAPWKMTHGYPSKVVFMSTAQPPERTLRASDFDKNGEEGMVAHAEFRANEPGTTQVDYTVSFSLCTDTRCVPQNLTKQLTVEVH